MLLYIGRKPNYSKCDDIIYLFVKILKLKCKISQVWQSLTKKNLIIHEVSATYLRWTLNEGDGRRTYRVSRFICRTCSWRSDDFWPVAAGSALAPNRSPSKAKRFSGGGKRGGSKGVWWWWREDRWRKTWSAGRKKIKPRCRSRRAANDRMDWRRCDLVVFERESGRIAPRTQRAHDRRQGETTVDNDWTTDRGIWYTCRGHWTAAGTSHQRSPLFPPPRCASRSAARINKI